jgi:tRNA threonylcarbamoyladenosine biosynthesis protein TsaB
VRLLGIETATSATAVALGDDARHEQVLADEHRRHTEVLAPTCRMLLHARGWEVADLDAIVVDTGPGLFTGLRVGVATAKGLALASGVGLLGVTSTDVLAQAACDADVAGPVLTVVDVRRGEVVAAWHECDADGAVQLAAPSLLTPDALVERLGKDGRRWTAVGDGAARHLDVLSGVVAAVRDDLVVPSPVAALRLARRRLDAGERTVGHDGVHPWYVREADAVANFAVRGPAT